MAIGISTGVNVAILALVIFLGVRQIVKAVTAPKVDMTKVDITEFKAPKMDMLRAGAAEARTRWKPPRARFPLGQSLSISLRMIQTPVPRSMCKRTLSFPEQPSPAELRHVELYERQAGFARKRLWHGRGNGNGNGYGTVPAEYRRRPVQRGRGITPPVPLNTVVAEFSDEARRNKYQGECLVSMIVDVHGNPQNPRVIRALGMGLDRRPLRR